MKLTAMRVGMSAFALAALVAAPAFAEDAAPVPEDTGPAVSDMKVARDKDTGKLRAPTAQESAELDAKSRSLAPSVVVLNRPVSTVEYRSDGSAVGKRTLDDMDDLTLTRTPDGKNVLSHSEDSAATTDEGAPTAPAQELPKE